MAERTYRDLAAFWRNRFPVGSDLSDELLVLRILREYPSFDHELTDLPSLYAQVEHDAVPLQAEWSDAKWQAVLEQWREALEGGQLVGPHQEWTDGH